MSLCSVCSRVDLRVLLLWDEEDIDIGQVNVDDYYLREEKDGEDTLLIFRHHSDIYAVRTAAQAGCELCILLWDVFDRREIKEDSDERRFTGIPLVLYAVGDTCVKASFAHETKLITLAHLDLSLPNDKSLDRTRFPKPLLRQLHSDPLDPGCMGRLANLLSQCIDHHSCSKANDGINFMPDRLLNVGNEQISPFLETRPDRDKSEGWVALSYCWGNHRPSHQLTTSSVEILEIGVPLQDFDATIRDAILVTRSLGIKYIWVDVLCIFQDAGSPDWPKQSSSMTDIYGYSKFTLIPLNSATASTGFLHKRVISSISIPWTISQNSVISCSDRNVCISERPKPNADKIRGPWTERAWTMQEELLSHRQIIFTASQIIWRCHSNIIYERGVISSTWDRIEAELCEGDEGEDSFWNSDNFTRFKLLDWYVELPSCMAHGDQYLLWYEFLRDYSSRQLTFGRDRLNAIAGLAARYGKSIGDQQYHAGLWEKDFILGLLWFTQKSKLDPIEENRAPENTFPSWSWASAKPATVVMYDRRRHMTFRYFAKVESISVVPLDESNPFGAVARGGRITIRGPVLHFSKLYWEDRESDSSLSPFLKHLSKVVQGEGLHQWKDPSRTGQYAAMLMVQNLSGFDNQLHFLLLRQTYIDEQTGAPLFRRIGMSSIPYDMERNRASKRLWDCVLKNMEKTTLEDRLHGRRRPQIQTRPKTKAVFEELKIQPWPFESLTIV